MVLFAFFPIFIKFAMPPAMYAGGTSLIMCYFLIQHSVAFLRHASKVKCLSWRGNSTFHHIDTSLVAGMMIWYDPECQCSCCQFDDQSCLEQRCALMQFALPGSRIGDTCFHVDDHLFLLDRSLTAEENFLEYSITALAGTLLSQFLRMITSVASLFGPRQCRLPMLICQRGYPTFHLPTKSCLVKRHYSWHLNPDIL